MKRLFHLTIAIMMFATVSAVDLEPAELEYLQLKWKQPISEWIKHRQGFGMNGAFYIRDNQQGIISRWDENGEDSTFVLEGGYRGHAVTCDEAGNILTRIDYGWPGGWEVGAPAIRVFPAAGGDYIDSSLPVDAFNNWGENGRMDYFGFAEGNVMEEGALYIISQHAHTFFKIAFLKGKVNPNASGAVAYAGANIGASVEGGSTCDDVINAYIAADGTRHLLYVSRSIEPVDITYDEQSHIYVGETALLPGHAHLPFIIPIRGFSNGVYPFALGGHNFFLYPAKLPEDAMYLDGFAIAEANADIPITFMPATCSSAANGIQANWLNAEPVDESKAIIYQYYPGGHIAVYEFKLKQSSVAIKGDVNSDGKVNVSDVTALVNMILGVIPKDMTRADVNGDGKINVSDVTALINIILGII
ncbi:MAG: dockerin type I repeat-containing protein [Muribaculaceae bacterium]|nr:dockerin type I repeat-containing protein [Muribaculaceae bacterium]